MFVPSSWQSHSEYIATFKNVKACFPSDLRMELFDCYSDARRKLFSLNLDPIGECVAQFYSPGGRPAKHQAQILRSFILFIVLFNQTLAKLSLTLWVETLSKNRVLATLIGYQSTDEMPPSGSYYDFMDRFWNGSHENYRPMHFFLLVVTPKKPRKRLAPMENWSNRNLQNTPRGNWWIRYFPFKN